MKAKVWYQSSTYHGLIVMIVGLVLGYFGLTGEEVGVVKSELMEILGLAGNVIGTIMIARGRNNATTKIALTPSRAKAHNALNDPVQGESLNETLPE